MLPVGFEALAGEFCGLAVELGELRFEIVLEGLGQAVVESGPGHKDGALPAGVGFRAR